MPSDTGYSYEILHPLLGPMHVVLEPDFAVMTYKPDVVLIWGDMTRPAAAKLAGKFPMAVCFAGGDIFGENSLLFNHIFVESQVYLDKLLHAGYDNVSLAFGTNTDLFQPRQQNKVFDTIFPATFAAWKRHNLYAQATIGLRSLACGFIYTDHETDCWQDCLDNGVTILPHVSANVLSYLYAASRLCVIPSQSDGGSQRSVLEAMAMNIPLVICDSDKYDYITDEVIRVEPTVEALAEAIAENLNQPVNTREHVLANWSHVTYANALEEGLSSLL